MNVSLILPDRLSDLAKDFVRLHIKQSSDLCRHDQQLSRNRIQAAAQAGLTSIQVPVKFGGHGKSFTCKSTVASILAGADFGIAMSIMNTHNVAADLAKWLEPSVANRWVPGLLTGDYVGCTALTEPGAGSDFAAIETFARRTPEGWRLDGQKQWIINATIADVILVYVQTQPDAGASGIACFVVDTARAGFERDQSQGPASVASSCTGGFRLNGYIAREDELVHPPGTAFVRALESINGARIYVAAMCCGMVSQSLHIAHTYGNTRKTFGQTLSRHQGWRWSLAQAAIDLEAAELLVAHAGTQLDAGENPQDLAAKAKVFATRIAQHHIGQLMHAMGAQGLLDTYPMMRHLEAAQIASLTDGSTEMLLERISRNLDKK